MNTHADKSQENKSTPAAETSSKSKSKDFSTAHFIDNRPESVAQKKLQDVMNSSKMVQQLKAKQETLNDNSKANPIKDNQPATHHLTPPPLQRKENTSPVQVQHNLNPIQEKSNQTGLPDQLKSGIENLSGYSLDDVKVHYNSDKPAQLQAHAYAQGTNIHLAAGQEKHLPHEAWHVVQQKQGRVRPTIQMKGNVQVNDDSALEKEADQMGNKAMIHPKAEMPLASSAILDHIIQRIEMETTITGTTHLVQAVHGSIYNGIQGRLLAHGTPIKVNTDDKIRSRRGPNQEIFREYDEKNAPEYRWVRVISVGGEPVSGPVYVRDDTFTQGATIPRGSAFTPSIDHRGRTQHGLPDRAFVPMHAPQWYQRELGHEKSSTADVKHAKLLGVAFGARPEHVGPAIRHHIRDEDTGMALATVEQHLTHVTSWIPENAENHGKDRHEGYTKSGEYFRTSPADPQHTEYENHQKLLGIYQKDVTTAPVNRGWAETAERVMGVRNMKDRVERGPSGMPFRVAEHPDRIARGPGAVIGKEEMASETTMMRQRLIEHIDERRARETAEAFHKIREELEGVQKRIAGMNGELDRLKTAIPMHTAAKAAAGRKMGDENRILAQFKVKKETSSDDEAAATATATSQTKSPEQIAAELRLAAAKQAFDQSARDEVRDKASLKDLNARLLPLQKAESELNARLQPIKAEHEFNLKYLLSSASGSGRAPLKDVRRTDLRPLHEPRLTHSLRHRDTFVDELFRNRRQVKLGNLFRTEKDDHLRDKVGAVTDSGGLEHPNLVLHHADWNENEDRGVTYIHDRWKTSGLKTNLQVRGSFGHYRPSVSPLQHGKIRINPGLYPMSLLQHGLGAALGTRDILPIDPRLDFIHRRALDVAVHHALAIVRADHPGRSEKIRRIKDFAKHRLMINLLKAQTILKAPIPDPRNREAYLKWLENDFSKTSQTLENLNESTHLLLSANVNEHGDRHIEEPLMLRVGPFSQFIRSTFAHGKSVQIYYVASGMQAITTGAMAAVYYRRMKSKAALAKPAGFVPLHPYFEMKDKTAAAAGFHASTPGGLPAETIVSDLSPLDTGASVDAQSQPTIKRGLQGAVDADRTLVPVMDATAIPLAEVPTMLPRGTENFIIVESLTKYAQLGSDKAIGGRIIVVGSEEFIKATSEVIGPVEQNANMVVSKIWFESMENMRYSH